METQPPSFPRTFRFEFDGESILPRNIEPEEEVVEGRMGRIHTIQVLGFLILIDDKMVQVLKSDDGMIHQSKNKGKVTAPGTKQKPNEVSCELALSNESAGINKKRKMIEITNLKAKRLRQELEEEEEERHLGFSSRLILYQDPWKIKKKLTISDVNNSCRLLVAAELVEKHIITFLDENSANLCRINDGMRINIRDIDTGSNHLLSLKRWKTQSFVLNNNWKEEFVDRRKLHVNDEIGIFWDRYSSRLCFRILQRS